MKIKCLYHELLELDKIIEHPSNRNNHPEKQIKALAKIIAKNGQRAPIVISNLSGKIVKGHGRKKAIELLGWPKAAVEYQDYENELDELNDRIADNEISRYAEFDREGFKADLVELNVDLEEIDFEEFGLIEFRLDEVILRDDDEDNDEDDINDLKEEDIDFYSQKILIPTYEPKNEKPDISDLYQLEKTKKLKEKINKSNIDGYIKEFLLQAANRHTVFNYEKIADFYAHSDKEVQELMEESALVIIDFGKAIENGFVRLTKNIMDIYDKESR